MVITLIPLYKTHLALSAGLMVNPTGVKYYQLLETSSHWTLPDVINGYRLWSVYYSRSWIKREAFSLAWSLICLVGMATELRALAAQSSTLSCVPAALHSTPDHGLEPVPPNPNPSHVAYPDRPYNNTNDTVEAMHFNWKMNKRVAWRRAVT